jgi:hypothetical protein
MEPFDFKAETDRMLLASQVIAALDLDQIIATVDRADSLGPIVDPTAYQNAISKGDMHAVQKLARELKKAVRVFHKDIAPRGPLVAAAPPSGRTPHPGRPERTRPADPSVRTSVEDEQGHRRIQRREERDVVDKTTATVFLDLFDDPAALHAAIVEYMTGGGAITLEFDRSKPVGKIMGVRGDSVGVLVDIEIPAHLVRGDMTGLSVGGKEFGEFDMKISDVSVVQNRPPAQPTE